MPEPRTNGILSAERPHDDLAEQLAAAELHIRELDEAARLSETELDAMERDLLVKEAFIRRLERGQQILSVELAQVRERAAELFEGLEQAEARIADLQALAGARAAELQAVRSSAAYRVGTRLVGLVRRLGPAASVARRLASARSGRGGTAH